MTSILIIIAILAIKAQRETAQALLDARLEVVNKQAQIDGLNDQIDKGIEYTVGILEELHEAVGNALRDSQWDIRKVSDEELPGFVQREVAKRTDQAPEVTHKLASQVGGKCFRVVDAVKRQGSAARFW